MPRDDAGEVTAYRLPSPLSRPLLALGGQMKARLALAAGRDVFVSSELADLGTPDGLEALEATALDMQRRHGVHAESLICDAHPGYTSARWCRARPGVTVQRVFHHHAHAAALAGEFPAQKRWLCFTWDGAGLGPDGTLWGGEALLGAPGTWRRVATFRPFAPPGGDKAARQPWRSAAALAWALGQDFSPPGHDAALVKAAWRKGVNAPPTSAVGRLFDAAASFLNLVHDAGFEAEGPIAVQALAKAHAGMADAVSLPLSLQADNALAADWAPLVPMLRDGSRPPAERAAAFHATMAFTLAAQAIALRDAHGDFAVGLTGGVFQNGRLAGLAKDALATAGFGTFLPQAHPCHDGGLSFGQIVEAAAGP